MHDRLLREIIEERAAKSPAFPRLLAEAEARRTLARKLSALREKRALAQTFVAARMGTSASVVSKLESGADVKMSTFQRYCAAIGHEFEVAAEQRKRRARVAR